MAVLMANNADHNFTGATWAGAEAGANAQQLVKSSVSLSTVAAAHSAAFTITNGRVIDGVLLNVLAASGGTGTLTVALALAGVTQVSVTVNISDLPPNALGLNTWVFFKFTATHTSAGAATYTISVASSIASSASISNNGVANNHTRALRPTNNNLTAAAADTFYLFKELTGAGTGNVRTVTNNNTTAATVFGKMDICWGGRFVYAQVASTSYYFNTNGILEVWSGGLLQMGTSGVPMAATNRAELLFTNVVNVDCGLVLYSGSSLVSAGPTKTIYGGVQPDLQYTITNKALTTNVITITTSGVHALAVNDWVSLRQTNDENIDGDYVVQSTPTTTTFTVNRTAANITSVASGGKVIKGYKATATASSLSASPTFWESGDLVHFTTTFTLTGDVVALSATPVSNALAHAALAEAKNADNISTYLDRMASEVINQTQRVKISGTSATLGAYIDARNGANVDCRFTQFNFLGSTTSNKTGFDFGTTGAASASFISCTFTNSSTNGIGLNITGSGTILVSGCAFSVTGAGSLVIGTNTLNAASQVINNIFGRNTNSHSVSIASPNITFTGNTIAAAQGSGLQYTSPGGVLGTFADNSFHGCGQSGISFLGLIKGGTITNCRFYRHVVSCVEFSTRVFGLTFSGCMFQSGNQQGVSFLSSAAEITFDSCIFHQGYAGSVNVQEIGVSISASQNDIICNMKFKNCIFGGPTFGGQTWPQHSTGDFKIFNSQAYLREVLFDGCKMNSDATKRVIGDTLMPGDSFVSAAKMDQVFQSHKTWRGPGTIESDLVIFDVSAPSERVAPNSFPTPVMNSSSKYVAINSGITKTITVRTRKSLAGPGEVTYNGSNPRLKCKQNYAAGVTVVTTLATGVAANGTWETLSGTSPVITDNAQLEFYVECDGTAGWVNVDNWTTT